MSHFSAQFSVTVKPNKDSKRLALTGTFTLEVTPTHLRLLNLVGTIPITGWAYRELKNFSLGKDCVEIDCGRSSGTGAGTFIFVTKEAKEVVRVIQHYIEKQLAGVRMPPSENAPAKAVNDSPPLKSKCSAEPSPPLKKAYHNYKPVVENDYGTTQDVLGMHLCGVCVCVCVCVCVYCMCVCVCVYIVCVCVCVCVYLCVIVCNHLPPHSILFFCPSYTALCVHELGIKCVSILSASLNYPCMVRTTY